LEKFDKVSKLLKEAQGFVQVWCLDNKWIPVEYNEGFQYIFRGVQALEAVARNYEDEDKSDIERLRCLLKAMTKNPYQSLSANGKVGVMVAQHGFLSQFQRHGYEDSLKLLQRVF
jgi:hypothetical protein